MRRPSRSGAGNLAGGAYPFGFIVIPPSLDERAHPFGSVAPLQYVTARGAQPFGSIMHPWSAVGAPPRNSVAMNAAMPNDMSDPHLQGAARSRRHLRIRLPTLRGTGSAGGGRRLSVW